MKLNIRSIRFKRSQNSPLEAGVMIVPSALKKTTLIDMFGKEVEGCWYTVEDEEFDITWKPGAFKERVAK